MKKTLVFLFVNLVLTFVGGCISEDNLKSEDELNNNQTVNENSITIKNLTSWGDSHKINDSVKISYLNSKASKPINDNPEK